MYVIKCGIIVCCDCILLLFCSIFMRHAVENSVEIKKKIQSENVAGWRRSSVSSFSVSK